MNDKKEIGKMFLISYDKLDKINLERIQNSFAVNLDGGILTNPYLDSNNEVALEKYKEKFKADLSNGSNFRTFMLLSEIESTLEEGKDVAFVTAKPIEYSHGKVLIDFLQTRLGQRRVENEREKRYSAPTQTTFQDR